MDEISKTIHEQELSLLQPEVRLSYDALNALLADDFMEFGSSGLRYDKKQTLEQLPKNANKVSYTMENFESYQLAEGIVLATYKTERLIDGDSKSAALRSSLWRNTDSGWKLFFHQATPVNII
jgi:hypothetical protein